MLSTKQNTVFSTNKTLSLRGRLLDLSAPRVMGILNITPDSFYTHSRAQAADQLMRMATPMVEAGATFLDIGGYSTRPGASDIVEEEEISRVVPALELLAREFPTVVLSIDTFRARVARAAVEHGASIINDVSGGTLDATMFATVASLGVPYILMHMRGTPQTMTSHTMYDNLVVDINTHLAQRVTALHAAGVHDIMVDPGFGFAKTAEQNFQLLQHLHLFRMHGKPLLAGLSRKSMIWKTLGITPEEALNGTTALHMKALLEGVSILRVHDVKEAMQVVTLYNHLNK